MRSWFEPWTDSAILIGSHHALSISSVKSTMYRDLVTRLFHIANMKARVRNAGGTFLFVLLGFTLLGICIFFFYNLFGPEILEFDEFTLTIFYIFLSLSSGSILIMTAISLALSDHYRLFGALLIILSLFCIMLSYLIHYTVIPVVCLTGIEFACGLILLIPRSWPLAKYILPYRVIHINRDSV